MNFKFDFICLTESKIQKGCEPKIDINIQGYQPPVGVPTESTKGGVLLYAKYGLNFIPRNYLSNLMYKSKELESIFIAVNNPKEINDIIGVIYRHPCMNSKTFNEDYLKQLNDKVCAENKHCYFSGDFNYNLLSTSTQNETFDFLIQ